MVTCVHCGTNNLEGVLVCETCGTFIGVDMPTPRLVTRKRTTGGLQAHLPYQLQGTGAELRLDLNTAQLYHMRSNFVGSRLVLGRADTGSEYTMLPIHVNNAVELGVSRYHAALIPAPEGIGIQDLGSTNGSYLNGVRLMASRIYRLEHGDVIQLGQLLLRVHLE